MQVRIFCFNPNIRSGLLHPWKWRVWWVGKYVDSTWRAVVAHIWGLDYAMQMMCSEQHVMQACTIKIIDITHTWITLQFLLLFYHPPRALTNCVHAIEFCSVGLSLKARLIAGMIAWGIKAQSDVIFITFCFIMITALPHVSMQHMASAIHHYHGCYTQQLDLHRIGTGLMQCMHACKLSFPYMIPMIYMNSSYATHATPRFRDSSNHHCHLERHPWEDTNSWTVDGQVQQTLHHHWWDH